MFKISTKTARRKLKQRREPYWNTITQKQSVGYRKGKTDPGTWIAKRTLPGGKCIQQRLGIADDLTDADPMLTLDFAAAVEAARDWFGTLGTTPTVGRVTVGYAMQQYLTELKRVKAETTVIRSEYTINKHVLPVFKDTMLTDLTVRGIREWQGSLLDKGLTKGTANRILTVFKAGLNLAFRDGHISSNKAWATVKPYKNAMKARDVFFTHEQMMTFLKVAKDIDPDYADLAEALFYSGARPGNFELVVLRVRDVDLAKATIQITEGKTGPRTVYLPSVGLPVFKRRIKGKRMDDLVFTDGAGEPWNNYSTTNTFRAVVKAAGLQKDAVPYSLRHSHISLALLNGLNIQIVAENCGTSIRMIEEHYGKFIPSDRRRLINAAF